MTDTPRIVVVDDEPEIRDMLGEYLTKQGYEVDLAADGPALRALVETVTPDVVLLDINLPGEDGLSLARWLREHQEIGVIMVTAAGDVVDRIVGLEIGADDYMAKPFDLREVRARIRSVLRRIERSREAQAEIVDHAAEAPPTPRRVRFGRCLLDLESHSLIDEDGNEQPLTAMEFDLLETFARHPNQVLNRDQLLDLAHNRDWEPFDRSIDIRIARIRRKIEHDPKKPAAIKTIRGVGYMFVPRGE
ncbi:MAG: response regulator [Alphaproteobacteria bacterium]|nr:response regulator [Alphaproteobacteria bacterium]